jgi:archaellum component FlaC
VCRTGRQFVAMSDVNNILIPALDDMLARLIRLDEKLESALRDLGEIADGLGRVDDQLIAASYKLGRIDARLEGIEARICGNHTS